MKRFWKILLLACILPMFASCDLGTDVDNSEEQMYTTRKYVNQFAFNVMKMYYLWTAEISDKMEGWMSNVDPIQKVLEVRYKDASGKDIDRWTQMTDDYQSFVRSIDNESLTYGYEFILYYASEKKDYLAAVVTLVYADTPADKAGLKRGDVIQEVDGSPIPSANYQDFVKNKLLYSTSCTIGLHDGRTVRLSAVDMYCDPIHTVKAFDCGGKKVGYLHFTAFTMPACEDLVKACNSLKAQNISELILDLRYNGGGYVQTEDVLASMLAPEEIVTSGTVFMTEIYNSILTAAWDESERVTHFGNIFKVGDKTIDTSESNLGLTKLYVIMTGGSASASEAVVCGLKPFMDLEIVGQQSYGKYCSGVVIEGANWYETYKDAMTAGEVKNGKKYAANWGIYVMIGRYADKDGNTPCMPDGFAPDFYVADNPMDGYQLGDPNETMLKAALTLAGYEYSETAAAPDAAKKKPVTIPGPATPKRETFGVFLSRQSI